MLLSDGLCYVVLCCVVSCHIILHMPCQFVLYCVMICIRIVVRTLIYHLYACINSTLPHSSLTYVMLPYNDDSVECVYKVRDATGGDHQSERNI